MRTLKIGLKCRVRFSPRAPPGKGFWANRGQRFGGTVSLRPAVSRRGIKLIRFPHIPIETHRTKPTSRMVDVSCRWRKPLLLMYNDNYRYGTGLYSPVVNSLDRPREYIIMPEYLPRTPAPLPKVSLAQHDLYAPISFGYGRSLLKPRTPEVPTRQRISSRYFPTYHGMDIPYGDNTNY